MGGGEEREVHAGSVGSSACNSINKAPQLVRLSQEMEWSSKWHILTEFRSLPIPCRAGFELQSFVRAKLCKAR